MSALRLFGRKRCQFIWHCRLFAEALHLHLSTWRCRYLWHGHSNSRVQAGVWFPASLQPLQSRQGPSFSWLRLVLFLPLPIFLFNPEAQPVRTVWPTAKAHLGVTADGHHVSGGILPTVRGVWDSAELLLPAASCRCGLEQPAAAPYHWEPAGGRPEHVLPPVDHCQAASCRLWSSTCVTSTTLVTQWTPTGNKTHFALKCIIFCLFHICKFVKEERQYVF